MFIDLDILEECRSVIFVASPSFWVCLIVSSFSGYEFLERMPLGWILSAELQAAHITGLYPTLVMLTLITDFLYIVRFYGFFRGKELILHDSFLRESLWLLYIFVNSGSSNHTIPIFSIHHTREHAISPGVGGEFSLVLFYNCGLF